MHKMKVAMITGSYPTYPCGVGDYTQRLSRELASQGLHVHVITTDRPEIQPTADERLTVKKLVPSWKLRHAFRLLPCLKQIGPDLIHVQYPTRGYKWHLLPNFLPLFCRLTLPTSTRVVTIHEFTIAHWLRKLGMTPLIFLSHLIILPDEREQKAVLRWFPWLKNRCKVIPIGANIDPVVASENIQEVEDPPWIVYFGFLTKSKDFMTLLYAFHHLLSKGVQCKLRLISELSRSDYAMIKRLGIEHATTVTGYCSPEQLSRYIMQATVCVLPFVDGVSLRRGTFLTALQHGLPVVTTWGRNVPQELVNFENVVMTPVGDDQAMSDAIVKLLREPDLRRKISNNAQKLGERFSWSDIALDHLEQYRSLVTPSLAGPARGPITMRQIKIALDGRLLDIPTGIGRYTTYLIQTLSSISSHKDFYILSDRSSATAMGNEHVKPIRLPHTNRVVWSNCCLPFVFTRESFHLFHAFDNLGLPLLWPKRGMKYVLTVHDIIPIMFPKFVKMNHYWYFSTVFKRLLTMSDAIIATSVCVRQNILGKFDIAPEKIHVIYSGIDHQKFNRRLDLRQIADVKKKFKLDDRRYILFVGVIEPKKNLQRLVAAYKLLTERMAFNKDYQLVIVGNLGWSYEDLFETINISRLHQDVRFLYSVDDTDLAILYSGAELFIFPSLYEGFGFPPLEAMACGCPVIVSDTASLPEVVGDAGLFVDPNSVDDIADLILRVVGDPSLRNELRQKGLERARFFSWEKTARMTLEVYDRAIHS